MQSGIRAAPEERYQDPFLRETDRRIRFLLAAAGRYAEAARFIEDLRRVLGNGDDVARAGGS